VAISRLVLSALASRNSTADVASHFLISRKDIEGLLEIALATTHDVIRYTWPDKYNIRVKLPLGFEESLRTADINFGDAAAEKFEKLYEWLTVKQDFAQLATAYASWQECRIGNYLSLDEPARALGLLRLLAQAGVDPLALRVCYRATENHAPIDPPALTATAHNFAVVFGMKPRTWPAAHRNWTPATYLQWDSPDCIVKPHASSGSVGGLNAWMLCIGAHVKHWNQIGESTHAQSN
jgi:hypothetical protein